jgi:hypothetical protein
MRSDIPPFAAITNSVSMYPEADVLNSTISSASSAPGQDSVEHRCFGSVRIDMTFGTYSAARATQSRGGTRI